MNIVTIILFGESSRGEVKADLRMVPLDELEAVESELELELVGEPAEVAAGEVADDEVEADEMADESDELLSDRLAEPSARPPLACCWPCCCC